MIDSDDVDADGTFVDTDWVDADPVTEVVATDSASDQGMSSSSALDSSPRFGSSDSDWNVGINEDTGNTVSKWPGGRHFDNMTWQEVEPK